MVRCNVEGAPALRSNEVMKLKTKCNHTSFAILFADDLELARTVALDPTFYPSEPSVQFFEECPRSCPVQHDHDGSMWKSGLRL